MNIVHHYVYSLENMMVQLTLLAEGPKLLLYL